MLTEKKINEIINAAEKIKNTDIHESKSLVFMTRAFVQATLPHSDPGNVKAWGRENGNTSISIEPGYIIKNNEPVSLGIPYGSIPRLLMFWITTEACRTKKKELVLGKSLNSFMKSIGLNSNSGGIRGDGYRLKEQMKRLFSSRIAISCHDQNGFNRLHYNLTTETNLWWDPVHSENNVKLPISSIILSTEFFQEIIDKPVPIDMRALNVLKQSPLALDLYAWLTYRVSYLKKRQLITWPQLHNQFGSDFTNIRAFRLKIRNYLKRICILYPELKFEDTNGGLILFPSPPHVPIK